MAQQSSPAQSSRANAGALNRFKHAMISQFKAKSCTSCHKLQAQVSSLSSEVSLAQELNKPLTFSKHTEQKLDWREFRVGSFMDLQHNEHSKIQTPKSKSDLQKQRTNLKQFYLQKKLKRSFSVPFIGFCFHSFWLYLFVSFYGMFFENSGENSHLHCIGIACMNLM